MGRTIFASVTIILLMSVPSRAADPTDTVAGVTSATSIVAATPVNTLASAAAAEAVTAAITPSAAAPVGYDWWRAQNRRPSALSALYVSSALLQVYDGYSTMQALRLGGVEANPMMKSAASNPMALFSVKAAVAAASIVSSERMWKSHHRTAAIVTMVVTNGFMAWVAVHNSHVVSGLQH